MEALHFKLQASIKLNASSVIAPTSELLNTYKQEIATKSKHPNSN
jgi:hypothetical protein